MGLLIGMDEAGYGPNLGPLVITVTVWKVPGSPSEIDCFNALSSIIARPEDFIKGAERLVVGDSKAVYSPARGLGQLEESVLVLLSGLLPPLTSFQSLHQALAPEESSLSIEPWYVDELEIPCSSEFHLEMASRWKETSEAAGIVLREVRSEFVLTKRYNQTVDLYDNKGLALSRLSLALLRSVWNPDHTEPTLVIADKHGGRNRYDELLAEVLEDRFLFRLEEGASLSRYRIGKTELRFQTKAESHFPVAVASMVSKYLRELAMTCFNRFWQSYLPDLKPTKGYPQDARRFREEIALKQKELGITDAMLWRSR